MMKRDYLKAFLGTLLCCSMLLAGSINTAQAQTQIDVTLKPHGPDSLGIYFRPNADWTDDGLFGFNFSIRWETASGHSIPVGFPNPDPSYFTPCADGLFNGWTYDNPSIVTDGIYTYFGINRSPEVGMIPFCDPGNGNEFHYGTIKVTLGSGCSDFVIADDAFAQNNNRSYFATLGGGPGFTGVIYGAGAPDIGVCLVDDCEGVPGGPALPGTPCDDNNMCTTGEVYQPDCSCAGGAPVDPNDNDPCTADSCDPILGVVNTFLDADNDGICDAQDNCPNTPGVQGDPCDDNNACTTGETLQADCSCGGGTAVDPDDGNACTVDSCDPVTGVSNTPVDPNDNDPCTLDSCDPVTGVSNVFQDADNDGICDAQDNCPNTPGVQGDPCDDNNACTTGETLQADCSCGGGTPVDPDDGNACTVDSCDPVTGVSNTPVDPDDNDPCTLDSCDPVTGVSNVFQDADNDGVCDALDNCPNVPGQIGDPCDDLDPSTSGDQIQADCSCAGVSNCTPGNPCDDGNACTTGEVFQPDCACSGGTPVDPDDNDPCTLDSCDPVTGVSNVFQDADNDGICDAQDNCPNTPGVQGDPCDDNNACTTGETLQADCSCGGGTPVDPDDGNACTVDSCDPVTGVSNTPVDPDDNDPCTLDSCDPVTGVSNVFQDADNDGVCDALDNCPNVPGQIGDPCDDLDPSTSGDQIQADCSCAGVSNCTPGNPCDDGNACTSGEVFQADCSCSGGTPVDPDDGNACTVDSCDPVTGVSNTPVDPDDNDPCTLDTCDPVTGVSNVFQDADNDGVCDALDNCPNVPGQIGDPCDDLDPSTSGDQIQADCSCAGVSNCTPGNPCDDGNACTSGEVFQADCSCSGGTPVDPDDNDPCTLDSCDPATGVSNVFQDADNDGVCDALDNCPNVPGQIGDPCDDLDPSTSGDQIQADCSCAGVSNCTPGNPCDDGNACTSGEVFQADCSCSGGTAVDPDDNDPCTLDSCDPVTGVSNVFQDADNDGVCDANDVCPGSDDNVDTDGDAIPDGCDTCPLAVDGISNFDTNTCNCDLGFFQNTTMMGGQDVITSCSICPIGFFCPDGIDALPCPAGFFGNITGAQACSPCPAGTFNPNTAAFECMDCPAGTTSPAGATSCTPVGSCTDVTLTVATNADGGNVSYEITPEGPQGQPVYCQQIGFPANSTTTETCCLDPGCYDLAIANLGSSGLDGYRLTDVNGDRIIDSWDNPAPVGSSGIANQLGFCLPLGTDELTFYTCDREDLLPSDFIVARNNQAVAAEFGVNDGNSGFQYWIFDPHGTYSRRIFLSHANPMVGAPAGETAVNHMRIGGLLSNPVPQDLLLNVRIRGRVNGAYSEFGPACRVKIDVAAANGCPTTQLDNNPSHQGTTFSCGVTDQVIGVDKIWALPINGANKYQFEFSAPGYLRRIADPSYVIFVGQWTNNPLQPGTIYDVRVRASFDSGANYCEWGDACTVGTAAAAPIAAEHRDLDLSTTGQVTMSLYPNPNRGEELYLTMEGLSGEEQVMQVDIIDAFGKQVHSEQIAIHSTMFNQALQLDRDLADGMYMVNVLVGDELHTARLVKQ